jgi:hypothetical protein
VRGVANLDDAGTRGRPARLGIAPEELEIDDGVVRGQVYKLPEDGRPLVFLHSGHLVHFCEHFGFVDGVVPVFGFGTGDLFRDVLVRAFLVIGEGVERRRLRRGSRSIP